MSDPRTNHQDLPREASTSRPMKALPKGFRLVRWRDAAESTRANINKVFWENGLVVIDNPMTIMTRPDGGILLFYEDGQVTAIKDGVLEEVFDALNEGEEEN